MELQVHAINTISALIGVVDSTVLTGNYSTGNTTIIITTTTTTTRKQRAPSLTWHQKKLRGREWWTCHCTMLTVCWPNRQTAICLALFGGLCFYTVQIHLAHHLNSFMTIRLPSNAVVKDKSEVGHQEHWTTMATATTSNSHWHTTGIWSPSKTAVANSGTRLACPLPLSASIGGNKNPKWK